MALTFSKKVTVTHGVIEVAVHERQIEGVVKKYDAGSQVVGIGGFHKTGLL